MSYENLFVHEIEATLQNKETFVLDMRDQRSYEGGHLTGAKRVNDNLIRNLVSKRKTDPAILIYCYHGHSSRDLATFFSGLGFSKVYNLEGGWHAWQDFEQKKYPGVSYTLSNWLTANKFSPTNINSINSYGMTPLMFATLSEEKNIVLELVETGANLNQVNNDGNNALWFGCVCENIEILNILIRNSIDIDNINNYGSTSLIYSSSAGKTEIVRLLVEAGADLSIKTPDEQNALDIASNISILKYLKTSYTNH